MALSYRIGEFEFSSRLILGTGKYPTFQMMREALEVSGTQMVTVAIRRVNLQDKSQDSLLSFIDHKKFAILPNTAACYDVDSAITTAHLAREALDTKLIKLEVIGDAKTLFPDIPKTLEAAKILLRDGFTVLPYTTDDPVTCMRLAEMGCHAVMPLAAPIGSGLGLCNPTNLKIILELIKDIPVIVDAGVGTASDATQVMEMGATAVLMNTGVAAAQDPVKMARSMKLAIEAGRLSFEAGRMAKRLYANASSPLSDLIE